METGNPQQVNLILRQYKNEYGLIKYETVFSIPRSERIPELAKRDFSRINMLIIGALTMAFKSLNLKNGLNEFQILDLSEAIIDTANEDNLSFEDLMLFLQRLTRGEYEMSDNINIPKFMKIFELYRQERYSELRRIQEELHEKYKTLGSTSKITKRDLLSDHFSKLGDRISEMKSTINSLKEENKNLKMDNL